MSGGRLVVLDALGRPRKEFPLPRGLARLGQHSNNEICICQPGVRAHHATVAVHAAQAVVQNVSDGETLVNGRAVSVAALQDGDIISVGGRALRWHYDDAAVRPLLPQTALAPVGGATGRGRGSARRQSDRVLTPVERALRHAERLHQRASAPLPRASVEGGAKQVAIVQPQRRDDASLESAGSGAGARVSPSTTKATLWIESRKASPRKSAPAARRSTPLRLGRSTPQRVARSTSLRLGRSTPLRVGVLKKQSALRSPITKIQAPLHVDHMKQAAILLMTGHRARPSPHDAPPQHTRQSPPPRKSALKDPRATSRKTESIKFDLSNLEQQPGAPLLNDGTHDGDDDITLHYSDTSLSTESPSPRKSMHSPGPGPRKSPRAVSLHKTSDDSDVYSQTESIADHKNTTGFKTRTLSPRSRNLESYSVVDLVSLDSTCSVYGSPGSARISSVFGTPQSVGRTRSVPSSGSTHRRLPITSTPDNTTTGNKRNSSRRAKSLLTPEISHKTITIGSSRRSKSLIMSPEYSKTTFEVDSPGRSKARTAIDNSQASKSGDRSRRSITFSSPDNSQTYFEVDSPGRSKSRTTLDNSQTTRSRDSSRRSKARTTMDTSQESVVGDRSRRSRTYASPDNSQTYFEVDSPRRSKARTTLNNPEAARGSKLRTTIDDSQATSAGDRSRRSKLRTTIDDSQATSASDSSRRSKLRTTIDDSQATSAGDRSRRSKLRTTIDDSQATSASDSSRRSKLRTTIDDSQATSAGDSSRRSKLRTTIDDSQATSAGDSSRRSRTFSSPEDSQTYKFDSPRRSKSRNTLDNSRTSFAGNRSRLSKMRSTAEITPNIAVNSSRRHKSLATPDNSRDVISVNEKLSKSMMTPENIKKSVTSRASGIETVVDHVTSVGCVEEEDSPRSSRRAPTSTSAPGRRDLDLGVITPVISIQSIVNSSQSLLGSQSSRRKPRDSVVAKRHTIAGRRSVLKRARSSMKSKSLNISGRKTRSLRLSKESSVASDETDENAPKPNNEETITPKSAVKLIPEAVKNQHSTAKKPVSKRSLIDGLDQSDFVKQLFNSPVKRKLSRSMMEFMRGGRGEGPRRPTRNTVALTDRTLEHSLPDRTGAFSPENFVSPLGTPDSPPSPRLSGVGRLFRRRTPRNDLSDVRGLKAVFARAPENRLSDVRVKRLFVGEPRDDLRDVAGVRRLYRRTSPANDLRDVSGVKRTLRASTRNDLRDVRGVRALFQHANRDSNYADVSGVERLYNESTNSKGADDTFDRESRNKAVHSQSNISKKASGASVSSSNRKSTSRELQKLSTATVQGSAAVRGARLRAGPFARPVHSTPVRGRVNFTMDASVLRVSPIVSGDRAPPPRRGTSSVLQDERKEITKPKRAARVAGVTRDADAEEAVVSPPTRRGKRGAGGRVEATTAKPRGKTTVARVEPEPRAVRNTRGRKEARSVPSAAATRDARNNVKRRRSSVVITKKQPQLSPGTERAARTKTTKVKIQKKASHETRGKTVDNSASTKKPRAARERAQAPKAPPLASPRKRTRATTEVPVGATRGRSARAARVHHEAAQKSPVTNQRGRKRNEIATVAPPPRQGRTRAPASSDAPAVTQRTRRGDTHAASEAPDKLRGKTAQIDAPPAEKRRGRKRKMEDAGAEPEVPEKSSRRLRAQASAPPAPTTARGKRGARAGSNMAKQPARGSAAVTQADGEVAARGRSARAARVHHEAAQKSPVTNQRGRKRNEIATVAPPPRQGRTRAPASSDAPAVTQRTRRGDTHAASEAPDKLRGKTAQIDAPPAEKRRGRKRKMEDAGAEPEVPEKSSRRLRAQASAPPAPTTARGKEGRRVAGAAARRR